MLLNKLKIGFLGLEEKCRYGPYYNECNCGRIIDLSSFVGNLNSYKMHAKNKDGIQSVKEKPTEVKFKIYQTSVVELISCNMYTTL